MSRSSMRWIVATLCIFLAVLTVSADDKKGQTAGKGVVPPPDTSALHATGQIVDCSNYLLLGKTPKENRDIQVKNLTAGMPACFISEPDGEVYLLVDLAGPAIERFQPIESFVGAGVVLDGIVYQKSSFKALAISKFGRTGAYEDRETRRPKNPEPTRRQNIKDPKANPFAP